MELHKFSKDSDLSVCLPVVDHLALDVAARQTAKNVSQAIATALLPMASTSDLTAVSQLIATALLPFVQQSPSPEHHPRHLSNLINAQAWLGQIIWDLLLGTNTFATCTPRP